MKKMKKSIKPNKNSQPTNEYSNIDKTELAT